MKMKNFVVCECTGCHKHTMYYMSEERTPDELEELDLTLDENGIICSDCSRCGNVSSEIDVMSWTSNDICVILGNILEDTNKHNLVGLPRFINESMKNSDISEPQCKKVLYDLTKHYEQYGSFS